MKKPNSSESGRSHCSRDKVQAVSDQIRETRFNTAGRGKTKAKVASREKRRPGQQAERNNNHSSRLRETKAKAGGRETKAKAKQQGTKTASKQRKEDRHNHQKSEPSSAEVAKRKEVYPMQILPPMTPRQTEENKTQS